jgi:hypothetical protein
VVCAAAVPGCGLQRGAGHAGAGDPLPPALHAGGGCGWRAGGPRMQVGAPGTLSQGGRGPGWEGPGGWWRSTNSIPSIPRWLSSAREFRPLPCPWQRAGGTAAWRDSSTLPRAIGRPPCLVTPAPWAAAFRSRGHAAGSPPASRPAAAVRLLPHSAVCRLLRAAGTCGRRAAPQRSVRAWPAAAACRLRSGERRGLRLQLWRRYGEGKGGGGGATKRKCT